MTACPRHRHCQPLAQSVTRWFDLLDAEKGCTAAAIVELCTSQDAVLSPLQRAKSQSFPVGGGGGGAEQWEVIESDSWVTDTPAHRRWLRTPQVPLRSSRTCTTINSAVDKGHTGMTVKGGGGLNTKWGWSYGSSTAPVFENHRNTGAPCETGPRLCLGTTGGFGGRQHAPCSRIQHDSLLCLVVCGCDPHVGASCALGRGLPGPRQNTTLCCPPPTVGGGGGALDTHTRRHLGAPQRAVP